MDLSIRRVSRCMIINLYKLIITVLCLMIGLREDASGATMTFMILVIAGIWL